MTAEPIARVVADLRASRTRDLLNDGSGLYPIAKTIAASDGKVVDATAIYHSLVERDDPVWIYEDHPCIAPPFVRGDVCYQNEHGNVIVMAAMAVDHRDGRDDGTLADTRGAFDDYREVSQPELWTPAQPVDWNRVRWTIDTFLWIGGRGARGPFPTGGPLHMWRFAVYENGEPADLHWVHLVPDYPMERWDMAHLVLLGALNFLNCRNVELVEPQRPRAERRRLARTGVAVHELSVFPAGRSTRAGERADGLGVPLASVRGHFAKYGPEFDRGLLFGRLAGRFWIPQHARGSADLGEHRSDYKLEADA